MMGNKYNRKRRLTEDDVVELKIRILQALLDVDVPRNTGKVEVDALADEFIQNVDLSLRAAAGDEPF